MHNNSGRTMISDEDNTIDYYLKAAWQSAANKYNQIAAQFGITQATGYVLINIHKEGTGVSQIANLLGVKTTSLSRILNNLEALGLIYRETNAADKRSVKVFLTEEGKQKRKLAKEVVRRFNAYLDEHITGEERRAFIGTLKRINQLAIQYKPQEGEHQA
jgi:Transcriptional regulators